MRGLPCTFSSAMERQVLNYGMYLCVGVWEWCRAGTPVDLGFLPAANLRAQDVSDGVSCEYVVDAIRHAFAHDDVGFCVYVTVLAGIFFTAILCCIALVMTMIILSKVYIFPFIITVLHGLT